MITLQGINKTFRVAKRQAGSYRAVKALFSREYETVHALNDISFTITDGEMVGYIGPNGAGKSTTIKIMCGILTPNSGSCNIDGRRVITLDPSILPVSDANVSLATQTELTDVAVSSITAEEMVAALYKEYSI